MKVNRKMLLDLRAQKKLSQYQLAEKSGISVVTLNKIETSPEACPFPSTVQKIAKALNVDIADIQLIDPSDNDGGIDPDKIIVEPFDCSRGVYGIFAESIGSEPVCCYIGKSEQLAERAEQHKTSILNKTSISSLNSAIEDCSVTRIVIKLVERVEYVFDNYYKDAQRLHSRESYFIDYYQSKNQCLEQVPEGRRPNIGAWEKMKALHNQ